MNDLNVTIKLLEIKCPYLGSSKSVPELFNDLKYVIKSSDGSLSLNKKDAYYSQVQLGVRTYYVKPWNFWFCNI